MIGAPTTGSPVDRVAAMFVEFVAALRGSGVTVVAAKQIAFLRAVEVSDLDTIDDLYWAARITLVTRHDDLPLFDLAFERCFVSAAVGGTEEVDGDDGRDDDESVTHDDASVDLPDTVELGEGSGREASALDLLCGRRLPPTRAEARVRCAAIASDANWCLPVEVCRRRVATPHGPTIDLRSTLREASRTGGEVVDLVYRSRTTRSRKLLMLVDVSGSLRADSPDFIRFAHAVVSGTARVEVFTMGTRLTRVTSELRHEDVDDALGATGHVVLDFDGGTMLGATFEEFLADARYRAAAAGAVVMVISDGLERGDPAPMIEATRRLARLAHRLVWLTPLAADPNFSPATRALTGVIDSLDRLGSAASLADLHAELIGLRALSDAARSGASRQTSYRPLAVAPPASGTGADS